MMRDDIVSSIQARQEEECILTGAMVDSDDRMGHGAAAQ
jgi:hypothetical protein